MKTPSYYLATLPLLSLVSLLSLHSITFDASSAWAQNARYALRVTMAGTGTGTVTGPPDLHCASSCFAMYERGTKIVLSAVPDSGSTFAGWSDGLCAGTGDCSLVVFSEDLRVTATFNSLSGSSGDRPGDRTGPSPIGDTLGAAQKPPKNPAASPDTELTILTASPLPDAQVGVSYSVPIAARGGSARMVYRVVQGSLPPGLRLIRSQGGSTALLTGRPARAGTRTFTVRVRDRSATTSKTFSLTVVPAKR